MKIMKLFTFTGGGVFHFRARTLFANQFEITLHLFTCLIFSYSKHKNERMKQTYFNICDQKEFVKTNIKAGSTIHAHEMSMSF